MSEKQYSFRYSWVYSRFTISVFFLALIITFLIVIFSINDEYPSITSYILIGMALLLLYWILKGFYVLVFMFPLEVHVKENTLICQFYLGNKIEIDISDIYKITNKQKILNPNRYFLISAKNYGLILSIEMKNYKELIQYMAEINKKILIKMDKKKVFNYFYNIIEVASKI